MVLCSVIVPVQVLLLDTFSSVPDKSSGSAAKVMPLALSSCSFAPLETLVLPATSPKAVALEMSTFPVVTVVEPVYVFEPVSSSVPAPVFVRLMLLPDAPPPSRPP